MLLEQTPSQTVGPFFHAGLVRDGEHRVALPGARGTRIVIQGQVFDGEGKVVPDALLEIWHADAAGIYPHPGDARFAEVDPQFRGFGRSDSDHAGSTFRFETIKPGCISAPDGKPQAPHACIRLFARGLLTHLTTRMYFADEPAANELDPVLSSIDPQRRQTLLAQPDQALGDALVYRWSIVLQGANETVFFAP